MYSVVLGPRYWVMDLLAEEVVADFSHRCEISGFNPIIGVGAPFSDIQIALHITSLTRRDVILIEVANSDERSKQLHRVL
jgi:hypothetical protein